MAPYFNLSRSVRVLLYCSFVSWCDLQPGDQASWALAVLALLALVANFVLLYYSKRSNDQSQGFFEALNRPVVFVSSVKFSPAKDPTPERIGGLFITIRNEGTLIAEGHILLAAGSFDRAALLTLDVEAKDSLVVYPKFQTLKCIDVDQEVQDRVTENEHYYILLRLRYRGDSNREWEYQYIGRWDALRDMPMTEAEVTREVKRTRKRFKWVYKMYLRTRLWFQN